MPGAYYLPSLNAFSAPINVRAAGMYEDIRTGPHHVFRIQLTLSQQGGQIMLTMLKYVPAALTMKSN